MARALAGMSPGEIENWFDGGPWDFEEGVDFPEGQWGQFATELNALRDVLGGKGGAVEIVHRDKACKVKDRTFRFHYLAMKTGWRGGL